MPVILNAARNVFSDKFLPSLKNFFYFLLTRSSQMGRLPCAEAQQLAYFHFYLPPGVVLISILC
jgi:hypothetical protein